MENDPSEEEEEEEEEEELDVFRMLLRTGVSLASSILWLTATPVASDERMSSFFIKGFEDLISISEDPPTIVLLLECFSSGFFASTHPLSDHVGRSSTGSVQMHAAYTQPISSMPLTTPISNPKVVDALDDEYDEAFLLEGRGWTLDILGYKVGLVDG
jgi:hypothetical protein